MKIRYPAAKSGNAEAQTLLGYLYYCGDFEIFPMECHFWLKKAAGKSHPEALAMLACTDFRQGLTLTSPETRKGLNLLRLAARKGSAQAQRDLACTYAHGTELPYDAKKVVYWYTRAAKQGHWQAQIDLAGMWLDGEAGKIDIERAVYWYRKCAIRNEQGLGAQMAAENLRKIYAGDFRPEFADARAAKYWLERAKELENVRGRSHPDWIYR